MDFDNASPIFVQLMRDITRHIVSGAWPPGSKTPSVRDLALKYSVNPNTMQRALAELEREGVLRSERAAGRFVTDDTKRIAALRQGIAQAETERYKQAMDGIGYDVQQVLALVREAYV